MNIAQAMHAGLIAAAIPAPRGRGLSIAECLRTGAAVVRVHAAAPVKLIDVQRRKVNNGYHRGPRTNGSNTEDS